MRMSESSLKCKIIFPTISDYESSEIDKEDSIQQQFITFAVNQQHTNVFMTKHIQYQYALQVHNILE